MHQLWTLIKIAFRNTFRNRRRTLLTIAIIVFGSTGLIIIGGFFDDTSQGYSEQYIHSQTGHLQISAKGYNSKGTTAPFDYLMHDTQGIAQEILANPHVLLAIPRLKFSGMLSSEHTSIPVMILGVDAQGEQKMGQFKYKDALHASINISAGTDLDPRDTYGAIVGNGLLKALNIHIGDTVNLVTMREGGALDGAQFKISGTFESIVKDIDDRTIKINLSTARHIFGLKEDAHSIVVLADKTSNAPLIQRELGKTFRDRGQSLEITNWEDLGSMSRSVKELFNRIYLVIQIIVSIVFFFSIANTLNMALFERMREFGTMMALGNDRRHLLAVIFTESCALALMGCIAAAVVGISTALIISSVGIIMPPPPMAHYGYYAMITLSPKLLFTTFLIAIVSTLAAVVAPSFRIIRTRIVDALEHI